MDWGGHLRGIGWASQIADDSIFQFAETGRYYDFQGELRLKNRLFLGTRWTLQTHYELVAYGGDTRKNSRAIERTASQTVAQYLPRYEIANDDHRLFNFYHELVTEDGHAIYQRLDRLNLTYAADWGTLRMGRQALSWGDGLIFNPMDLFNPFAPTTVQRDYKTGDDMIHLQLLAGQGEVQALYLPRRNTDNGKVQDDASSYAVKYHTPIAAMEMDLMLARHYQDDIVGLGASGYFGDAAWRINMVYTASADDYEEDDFFQIVANMDYAWIIGGKNIYGLLEFYHNGLGSTEDYQGVIFRNALLNRLGRGEMFTIGSNYMAGKVQIECHPLLRLDTTVIVNLNDPSGVFIPQASWDIADDVQLLAGLQWYWGDEGSEFGGYDVTVGDATFSMSPSDTFFVWLTYYF